jgi:hypothetical protein
MFGKVTINIKHMRNRDTLLPWHCGTEYAYCPGTSKQEYLIRKPKYYISNFLMCLLHETSKQLLMPKIEKMLQYSAYFSFLIYKNIQQLLETKQSYTSI